MRLTIESTTIITEIDGVSVRLWRGVTGAGRPVDVFIHRLGSDDPAACAELEALLVECKRPVELRRIMSREG